MAGVVLAAAIAVAGARPALAASRWNDGSGQSMYYARALSSGKGVIGEFEEDNTQDEYHWYKFKTSGRNSVYSVKLESVDGRKVNVCPLDGDGNYAPGNWYDWKNTTSTASSYTSKLDKSGWYYFEVGAANLSWGGAKKYDQFKITVTEYPLLRAGAVTGTRAYRTSARVSWRKESNATSYQVRYRSQNAKGKWRSWKSKTVKGTSLKISGLVKGKKVQVKVRHFRKNGWDWSADKKSNYGGWSATRTFRTKK